MDVTTAVKLPAEVGLVEKVTVKTFAVAAVTAPTAPLLKTTELLDPVGSNPNPLIVMLEPSASKLVVLLVTTGLTVATWMIAPLLTPLVVTVAFRFPADGRVERVTVSAVAVAEATVPTAPESNTIVLLAAVVSNPAPTTVTVLELPESTEPEFKSTTGAIVATGTRAPLA